MVSKHIRRLLSLCMNHPLKRTGTTYGQQPSPKKIKVDHMEECMKLSKDLKNMVNRWKAKLHKVEGWYGQNHPIRLVHLNLELTLDKLYSEYMSQVKKLLVPEKILKSKPAVFGKKAEVIEEPMYKVQFKNAKVGCCWMPMSNFNDDDAIVAEFWKGMGIILNDSDIE